MNHYTDPWLTRRISQRDALHRCANMAATLSLRGLSTEISTGGGKSVHLSVWQQGKPSVTFTLLIPCDVRWQLNAVRSFIEELNKVFNLKISKL